MATWSIELPSGAEYELSMTANGVRVLKVLGERMAPVENIATNYALVDGALYQRTAVRPRILTFVLAVTGTSVATLLAFLDALVTATNPHRPVLPVKIWYRSGAAGTGRYINGYYEGGLEGIGYKGYVANPHILRFRCTDPFWYYETPIANQALDVYDAMVTPNRIISRNASGTWDNMDAGANSYIRALALSPTGELYAGGNFTTIGGVACNRVAKWDGAAWSALGVGVDGIVYSLAFAPNGDLYVGGAFTNAGGAGAARIAYWDVSASAWVALGAGVDGTVFCMAFAPNGNLYVGGAFSNAGGAGASKVAMWNGAAWAALGVGVDDQVNAVAITANGAGVYWCGKFANAGGAGATRVALWTVATTAWSALGTGVDQTAYALAIASNGDLFIGGNLDNAGGIVAGGIAKWNGVTWSALGEGTNGSVYALKFDTDGLLYVGGLFNTLGSIATTGNWGVWHNGAWLPAWIGTVGSLVWAFVLSTAITAIAGDFTAATVPGVTTITTTCSARAYPVIAITGPGRLLYLINYSTNQVIYFDITLVASEVLTIDLRERVKTVTSSFRGNLISGVLAGSLTTWYLQPGANYIGCYVDNAAASAVYGYTPRYWGAT